MTPSDLAFETAKYFKSIANGTQTKAQIESMQELNPDQKKRVLAKLKKQKHFMLPMEIKQLKSALMQEEFTSQSKALLIKDFSNIEGKTPRCESPKNHNFDINEENKFSKSVYLDQSRFNKKTRTSSVKNLPPKLKEILSNNKDMLSKNFMPQIFYQGFAFREDIDNSK